MGMAANTIRQRPVCLHHHSIPSLPQATSKMKTAWHQQYRGLVRKGLCNPDPQEQFMFDLGKFLTEIHNDGADYILGWDANTPYDSDDIQDFLQDHDMVDAFTEFFED
jgi:hypothetical protein